MKTYNLSKKILINTPNFSLSDTLECGQCFRAEKLEENCYLIFAGDKSAVFEQKQEFLFCSEETYKEWNEFWSIYFDANTDYLSLQKGFCGDSVLETAYRYAGGIHILKQDPWEALCSFIISANNNIPRIKGIISSLCSQFGTKIPEGYGFPSAKRLSKCSVEELAPIRAGFRAKYILDAAQKVSSGEVSLETIGKSDIQTARNELMKIKGVGKKVAECALLYGFHRFEAFPIDVWINRVLEEYYPNGISPQIQSCPGVAQQILFHYIRKISKNNA